MPTYIRLVLRHRFIILALMMVLTALSGWSISRGVIASSMINFLGEHPQYQEYLSRTREFANDEMIIVGFEDSGLLTKGSLDRLKVTVDKLKTFPGFNRVMSLFDLGHFQALEGGFEPGTYAEKARENPARAAGLLTSLCSDPMARGVMVSHDCQSSLVLIELKPDENRRTENYPPLVGNVLKVFTDAGFERNSLHLTGMIPIISEVIEQSEFNLTRLSPITAAVLLFTAYLMFRRLWPVLITAVDDTIHFLMRYRREILKGFDPDQAMSSAFHYSGRAIIMTSTILVFGFLPFALSDYFTVHMIGTLLPAGLLPAGLLPAGLLIALAADLFLVPAMIKLGAFQFKR